MNTECPYDEGVDASEPYICHPCKPGYYASAHNDACTACEWRYINGVTGATDDSGCTSMYTD